MSEDWIEALAARFAGRSYKYHSLPDVSASYKEFGRAVAERARQETLAQFVALLEEVEAWASQL